MTVQINGREIVESVVLDMLTEYCLSQGMAVEDAGIFFANASIKGGAVLVMAEKYTVYGTSDPMDILDVDVLTSIEDVCFRNVGSDDQRICDATKAAMLEVFSHTRAMIRRTARDYLEG